MSNTNPTKPDIERMLAAVTWTDSNGITGPLVVSDDSDGSEPTVRVALAGVDSADNMRAVWQIECQTPYGTDIMPLLGIVLRTLIQSGRFAVAQPAQADPTRKAVSGEPVRATVQATALGVIWTGQPAP